MQRSGVYRHKPDRASRVRGLHLHSTFAVTSSGLPLGVLRAECTARGSEVSGRRSPLSAIPIEEKNTFSWIQGVRDCMDIKPLMPHTALVSVMDREADFLKSLTTSAVIVPV